MRMKDHPVFQELQYQNLVDLITPNAPEGWKELYVVGLYHDDVMKIETFSWVENDTEWKKCEGGGFELFDWFEGFIEIVNESEKSDLKSVKFSIDRTGKLKGKFGYDPVDALSHRDLRAEIEPIDDLVSNEY